MDGAAIVQLSRDRDERAIPAASAEYGTYCTAIAESILGSAEDAEECVNDPYLNAWSAMPPHRPDLLSAFLGRIVRNLSLNRYRHNTAGRRGGALPAVPEGLSEPVSGGDDVGREIDRREPSHTIDAFWDHLSPEKRSIFISRCWYTESSSGIAARHSMRNGAVSMALNRLRLKLRSCLLKRGFEL